LTQHNANKVAKIFDAMTADSPVMQNRQLKIWGRSLTIPESSENVARFTFGDLCGKPLSAVDYIELTRAFHTIFVLDVPKMDLNQKDMVCRTRAGVKNIY
jgi:protein AFG1